MTSTIMQRLKGLFGRLRNFFIAAALLAIAAVIYFYVASSGAPSFRAYTVARGDLTESVDVTGNVSADHNASLSFQESGRVAAVPVEEGATVAAGAVLAELDQSSLEAAVEQANAALAAAEAKLSGMENGTRPEQIALDEGALTSAESSLAAALESAYVAADDAVRNQADNLFSNPMSTNPVFLVAAPDAQLVVDIEAERQHMTVILDNWYVAQNATSSNEAEEYQIASASLQSIESYLNNIALAVESAVPSGTATASTLASYKTDIIAARSEITGADTALSTANAAFTAAGNTLALAKAGSTPEDIAAEKAVVLQAQAAAASAEVALNHAVLRAPFAGSISNLNMTVGEVVSAGTPVATITNPNGMKMEAYASENDVAKLAVGDQAAVTLDAYGSGVTFPATVTALAAAETEVNGAPAYEVTLHFTGNDDRIKDGMTGTAHIVAASRANVLEVPTRLILSDNNHSFVLVKSGPGTEKREVVTGLTGNDGMTEIVSGVSAGEQVVNF